MVAQVAEEVHYPDGRVGLASPDEISDSRYANGDLAPVPIERRTWTTYNYTALWVGMSHCIPTYLLASGLIALGMNWVRTSPGSAASSGSRPSARSSACPPR